MIEIQTTRDHDKDMLIAGFKHDLAKAKAEIERLRAALKMIGVILNEDEHDIGSALNIVRALEQTAPKPKPSRKPEPYSRNCLVRNIPGATCQSPNCDC